MPKGVAEVEGYRPMKSSQASCWRPLATSYIVALDYSTSGLEVGKKVSISEDLFKRLCGRQDLEGYGVKLGRWVLREEIGEFIGREGEGEGQVEEKRSKR